ncbi:MAG: hydrogenase iron-sulfur subunit [Verrucomicrobia bacterium]|nr:hydrogenase iron-sulfur subunit [Verrucomicrobiota bacterium]
MTESPIAFQDEAQDTTTAALPQNGHAQLPLTDDSPSRSGSLLEPSPSPALWGESLLRRLENGVLLLDRVVHQFIPPALNPFAQIGAIANTCFIIAVVTGIALLLWYTPSVQQAYSSLEAVRQSSWLGQLMRSLHRYSSDGCLFLILLHTLRIFLARRFTGPRWFAWATGAAMLALVWFIGWTGYWLVWDVRAQHVALGTAKFIDYLPLFVEPLARSFLTDASVHSLFFFLIFFAHMLLPLLIAVGLWMHLMRVNRAKLFTGRTMTLWIVGSLIVLSVLLPATSAAPAHMTIKAQKFSIDWWYLWPLALTDRLGGGLLWGFFLLSGLVTLTVPWWMVKRRPKPEHKAVVDLARCFGCTLCAKDCPFNAITMAPREDGRNFPVQSQVNPALCVGCGICTGACDSQAINLPALDSRELGQRLHAWIDEQKELGEQPYVAFVCSECTGNGWNSSAGAGPLPLPSYRVFTVPCVGWVSAVLLERALQRGAEGILIVGCGEGDPACREGAKWFQQRLAGQREPKFDPKKADPSRIRFAHYDRTRRAELLRAANEFRAGAEPHANAPLRSGWLQIVAATVLAVALGAVTYAFSELAYRTPHNSAPEFVISFNHRGEAGQPQRQLTKEELDKRLPHMRAQITTVRHRVPVRLRVHVDGQQVLDQSYQPRGLSGDGPSIAIARLPVTPGAHAVRVELADTPDASKWTRQWTQSVEFEENRVRVLLFDTKAGFTLD